MIQNLGNLRTCDVDGLEDCFQNRKQSFYQCFPACIQFVQGHIPWKSYRQRYRLPVEKNMSEVEIRKKWNIGGSCFVFTKGWNRIFKNHSLFLFSHPKTNKGSIWRISVGSPLHEMTSSSRRFWSTLVSFANIIHSIDILTTTGGFSKQNFGASNFIVPWKYFIDIFQFKVTGMKEYYFFKKYYTIAIVRS